MTIACWQQYKYSSYAEAGGETWVFKILMLKKMQVQK